MGRPTFRRNGRGQATQRWEGRNLPEKEDSLAMKKMKAITRVQAEEEMSVSLHALTPR